MAGGISPGLAAGTVLTVGPGQTYALPSEAARNAQSGDIIRIFPGTYSDCTTWDADGLVIEGAGPNVVLAGKVCDGKGIFVTRGNGITIRNMTFMFAQAPNHNGAGIRVEGANLAVEDSRFIDNENGILTAPNAASVITIKTSTFRGNGNCIAACAHGIYIGHIALLRVENSTFEAQHVGHHIKSRAARTEIVNNTVQDGPAGSASYLVDLPNGGSALITGNSFEKGPRSSNRPTAIAIGAEGESNPAGDIVVEDNSFSNDTGAQTVFVRNYTGRPVTLLKNRLPDNVTPLAAQQPARENSMRP
ncbi:MAG: right-handed parallel beta-helix repeat-containing protein [Rhizomicrobium sp.]